MKKTETKTQGQARKAEATTEPKTTSTPKAKTEAQGRRATEAMEGAGDKENPAVTKISGRETQEGDKGARTNGKETQEGDTGIKEDRVHKEDREGRTSGKTTETKEAKDKARTTKEDRTWHGKTRAPSMIHKTATTTTSIRRYETHHKHAHPHHLKRSYQTPSPNHT
jgi:hypothetical protein